MFILNDQVIKKSQDPRQNRVQRMGLNTVSKAIFSLNPPHAKSMGPLPMPKQASPDLSKNSYQSKGG